MFDPIPVVKSFKRANKTKFQTKRQKSHRNAKKFSLIAARFSLSLMYAITLLISVSRSHENSVALKALTPVMGIWHGATAQRRTKHIMHSVRA
jgi:hypothetical protein